MYRVFYSPYRRVFRHPLQTRHGQWAIRQGVVIRLDDQQGRIAFGEIAPIDWFGTETLDQVIQFCRQLPPIVTEEQIQAIPPELPACQFGFEAAWEQLTSPNRPLMPPSRPTSGLLPAGKAAVQVGRSLWQQGYRTLKWKIGVSDWSQEFHWLTALLNELPPQVHLRLDANGGLSLDTAHRWLAACSDRPQVEFLEQPLPPAQLDDMVQLREQYPTPIALDESVTTLTHLYTCYQRGWRGIVVIKPAIAGFPSQLRHFCQTHALDLVWSSALETAIAQQFIQGHLIPSVPSSPRAIGFGVQHWFTDDWHQLTGEQLWQVLCSI